MADFITLSCPSCGGKLQITNDVERFACSHCGNEHVVKRGGGIVSLAPVMAGLQKVQASTDRVGAELAIQRLIVELEQSGTRLAAAKKKAQAASQKSGSILEALFIAAALLVAAWFLLVSGQNLLAQGLRVPENVFCPGAIFLVAGAFGVLVLALRRNAANVAKRVAIKAADELRAAEKTDDTIRAELARQRTLVKG